MWLTFTDKRHPELVSGSKPPHVLSAIRRAKCAAMQILSEAGRWQAAGLTEGSRLSALAQTSPWAPSTASRSPSPFRGGF